MFNFQLRCIFVTKCSDCFLLIQDQDLRVRNKNNTPTSSSSIIQDNGGTSEHNSPTLPGLGGQKTGNKELNYI